MGACTFTTRAKAPSAKNAFEVARAEAQYEHGHGGYTGTIAEKSSFVEIPLPVGMNARDFAETLIDNDDPRIRDKWGPAGCVKVAEGEYLFFGWASS